MFLQYFVILLIISSQCYALKTNKNEGVHFYEHKESKSNNVMNSFQQLIHQQVVKVSGLPGSNFISFLDVTLPVNLDYFNNFNDDSNENIYNLYCVSELLDLLPISNGVDVSTISIFNKQQQQQQQSLSTLFLNLLNNISTTNVHKDQLAVVDDKFKEKLNYFKITNTTTGSINDSPIYKSYIACRNVYDYLNYEYNFVQYLARLPNATRDKINFNNYGNILYSNIEQQSSTWSTFGDKEKIDDYIEEITTSINSNTDNFNYFIQYLNSSMNGSKRSFLSSSGDDLSWFYPSYFYPYSIITGLHKSIYKIVDPFNSFNNFSLNTNQIPNDDSGDTYYEYSFKISNGKVSGDNGSSDGDNDIKIIPVSSKDFNISFNIVQLPIHRPWFSKDFGPLVIGIHNILHFSNGIIMAKDIKITFSDGDNIIDIINQLDKYSTVMFGPFLLKGKLENTENEVYYSGETVDLLLNGTTIHYPGIQIIALLCNTPNANSYVSSSSYSSESSSSKSTSSPLPTQTPSPSPSSSSPHPKPSPTKNHSSFQSIFPNSLLIPLVFISFVVIINLI